MKKQKRLTKLDALKDLESMEPFKEKILIKEKIESEIVKIKVSKRKLMVALSDGENYLYGFYLLRRPNAIIESLYDISSAHVFKGQIKDVRVLEKTYHSSPSKSTTNYPSLEEARYNLIKLLLERN